MNTSSVVASSQAPAMSTFSSRFIHKKTNQIMTRFKNPSGVISNQPLLELRWFPLLLPLVATAILLHVRAAELTQNRGKPSKNWLKILLESGVATAIVNSTSGVYPLVCLGKSAYESGKVKDGLGKLQVLLQNATMFAAGYLGVHVANGLFVEGSIESEEAVVRGLLNQKEFLARFRHGEASEKVHSLAETLETLLKNLNSLDNHFIPIQELDIDRFATMKESLGQLKTRVHADEALQTFLRRKEHPEGVKRFAEQLTQVFNKLVAFGTSQKPLTPESLSEFQNLVEALKKTGLDAPDLQAFFKDAARSQETQALGKELSEAVGQLAQFERRFLTTRSLDLEEIKVLKQTVATLKREAFDKLHPLYTQGSLNTLIPKNHAFANSLRQLFLRLQDSQSSYVQLSRRITPMCGYLIATALVGMPLGRLLSAKLAEWLPELRHSHGPLVELPDNTLIPHGFDWFKNSRQAPLLPSYQFEGVGTLS